MQPTSRDTVDKILVAFAIALLLGLAGIPLLIARTTPTATLLPPEQTVEAYFASRRQTALARPRSTFIPTGPDPANLLPTSRALTGILEERQGPFPSEFIRVENQWQEYLNATTRVQVFALWRRDEQPPVHAFLRVYALRPGGVDLDIEGSFPTPRAVGPVRIVAANGLVLTLASANGEQFLFDVGLGRYLDPSEVATPTTPTLTPPITVPYPAPAPTVTGLPPIDPTRLGQP